MSGKIKRRNRNSFKGYYIAMALVLVLGCAIGGTLAWLVDSTDEVVNTFTPSDINITLKETETDFKMIPGWTIKKDPVVTVEAGSEDCWVFIEVSENCSAQFVQEGEVMPGVWTFGDYITYAIDDGWKPLASAGDGVYYREVAKSDANQTFGVLDENQVLVNETVTKEMMDAIDGIDVNGSTTSDAAKAEVEARPTLTFVAYATQMYKSENVPFDVEEAWKIVSGN